MTNNHTINGRIVFLDPRKADHTESDLKTLMVVELVIFPLIFVACMCGNIILITAIAKVKHLRRISHALIVNLAICDMTLCFFSIPFDLVLQWFSDDFIFGDIGCMLIYPLATYGSNASALTLVCIAIERYMSVSSLSFRLTKREITVSICVIHILAFIVTAPYSINLKLGWDDGLKVCTELWGMTSRRSYTLVLFMVQYGLPLPLMAGLYMSAWCKIKKQNKRMINMSEEYERKMEWEENDHAMCDEKNGTTINFDMDSEESTVSIVAEESEINNLQMSTEPVKLRDNNTDNDRSVKRRSSVSVTWLEKGIAQEPISKKSSLPLKNGAKKGVEKKLSVKRTLRTIHSIKHAIKLRPKPSFISHTAYVRHKQTVKTLKMFITVVVVFLIFSCPNQVRWLIIDFYQNVKLPVGIKLVFKCLTYANSVVNCWIYGGFNPSFRRAYKQLLQALFTCSEINGRYHKADFETTVNDLHCTAQHSSRKEEFDDMFQELSNGFEKYRHLYRLDDFQEDNQTPLLSPPKPKRKITIASIWNALTPSSRKNSVTSPTTSIRPDSRKFSLAPPIIPFSQAVGNAIKTDPKQTRKISIKQKRRRASTTTFYDLKRQEDKSVYNVGAINLPFTTINSGAATELSEYVKHTNKRRASTSAVIQMKQTTLLPSEIERKLWQNLISPTKPKVPMITINNPSEENNDACKNSIDILNLRDKEINGTTTRRKLCRYPPNLPPISFAKNSPKSSPKCSPPLSPKFKYSSQIPSKFTNSSTPTLTISPPRDRSLSVITEAVEKSRTSPIDAVLWKPRRSSEQENSTPTDLENGVHKVMKGSKNPRITHMNTEIPISGYKIPFPRSSPLINRIRTNPESSPPHITKPFNNSIHTRAGNVRKETEVEEHYNSTGHRRSLKMLIANGIVSKNTGKFEMTKNIDNNEKNPKLSKLNYESYPKSPKETVKCSKRKNAAFVKPNIDKVLNHTFCEDMKDRKRSTDLLPLDPRGSNNTTSTDSSYISTIQCNLSPRPFTRKTSLSAHVFSKMAAQQNRDIVNSSYTYTKEY